MVITGLTRNQFESNLTRVRIPPSPPLSHRLSVAFLLAKRNLLVAKYNLLVAKWLFAWILFYLFV